MSDSRPSSAIRRWLPRAHGADTAREAVNDSVSFQTSWSERTRWLKPIDCSPEIAGSIATISKSYAFWIQRNRPSCYLQERATGNRQLRYDCAMHKKLITLALCLLALAACKKKEAPAPEPTPTATQAP